jgi:hypothetical protein
MRLVHFGLLLAGLSSLGCNAVGKCAYYILDAWEYDSDWASRKEEQRKQAEIAHALKQIEEDAMRD